MARIRSIKPDFPQSESMGRVSRDARLLFIQLWTIADDHGKARASSRMLASLLYPYDDDAPELIDGWLSELEAESCIARYVIDRQTYLQIVNWTTHQRIDRPSASKYPPFDESSRALASPRDVDAKIVVGREGKGREGKGEEGIEKTTTLAKSAAPDPENRENPDHGPAEKPPALVNGSVPSCPIDDLISAYHSALPSLPRVRMRNSTRDKLLTARWRQAFEGGQAHTREEGLALFREFFSYVGQSKFLTGKVPSRDRNKPPFLADLGWLMGPDNFAKTVEGHYHR